jgi:hypothetical protein
VSRELKLDDFEKMKNHTGLVPMRVVRSFAPYAKNQIAGFPPEYAFIHYREGNAVVYVKDGPEIAHPDPAPVHHRIPGVSAEKVREDTGMDNDPNKPIEIPAQWADMHHLQRIKLAQNLGAPQAPEGVKPIDHFDAFIKAEVEKRAKV